MIRTARSEDLVAAPFPCGCGATVFSTTRRTADGAGLTREGVVALLRQSADPPRRIVFADQCHSAVIHDADSGADALEERPGGWLLAPNCDGLVSRERGCALIVRTADCCPVIIASEEKPWLAALHAGWRGTLARITSTAIGLALAEGLAASRLHLWIGPCIGGDAYEVSEELADRFAATFGETKGIRSGRQLDLARVHEVEALEAGIPPENLYRADICTHRQADLFPSYRRDGRCDGQIHTCCILTR